MKLNNKQLQEFNNKDYEFFVCDTYDGLQILSGWEYKEDARDDLKETQEDAENCYYNVDLRVFTRKTINRYIKGTI